MIQWKRIMGGGSPSGGFGDLEGDPDGGGCVEWNAVLRWKSDSSDGLRRWKFIIDKVSVYFDCFREADEVKAGYKNTKE